jgi:hypothetical protein
MSQVAMDFSNLEAVLQGLLANAQRMQRIADAAYGANTHQAAGTGAPILSRMVHAATKACMTSAPGVCPW